MCNVHGAFPVVAMLHSRNAAVHDMQPVVVGSVVDGGSCVCVCVYVCVSRHSHRP